MFIAAPKSKKLQRSGIASKRGCLGLAPDSMAFFGIQTLHAHVGGVVKEQEHAPRSPGSNPRRSDRVIDLDKLDLNESKWFYEPSLMVAFPENL